VSSFIEAKDRRRIAYADTGGDGPAVLCLPGLTRTMVDYADLAAHLAPRYRVIRTDYRGRGASAWAEDPLAEYSPIVEGQDAAVLLTHLGITSATVIGTSRGGIIGMLLGAMQPGLLNGLVLNDIGPVVERGGLEFIMTYLGLDPGARSFAEAADRLRAVYARDFPDLTDAQWMAFARRSFADRDGVPILNYDPKLRDATAAALENSPPDLWQVFDALVDLPILAVRGENSNLLTGETLAEMARRRPDMAHVTVANRGHVPFLDEPVARAAIDQFLEGHA
jgi:pimeloyl-ACP methyl ester carboxylesterase